MAKPTDHQNNQPHDPNHVWRLLRLGQYFSRVNQDVATLSSLYVSQCYVGEEGYAPLINLAYAQVLNTPGVHRPDGTVAFHIPRVEGDVDCAHIAEFIERAHRIDDEHPRVRRRRASDRLLVILGGIGEGKSTLLDYFFRVHSTMLTAPLHRLNLDFDEAPDWTPDKLTPDAISEFLLEQIRESHPSLFEDPDQLQEMLAEVLAKHTGVVELIRRKKGDAEAEEELISLVKIYSASPATLVTCAINHLAKKLKLRVVVTLDNVDHLPASCQSRAVSLIREALHAWDCAAIACVREYNYGRLWVHTEWGFESPLLYHKRPPRFDRVLQKRFEYSPFARFPHPVEFVTEDGKKFQLSDSQLFMSAVPKFLWLPKMETTLLGLCNGNVRELLLMVEAFLSFHALRLEDVLTAMFLKSREEGLCLQLTCNMDRFLQAIIVGNHEFYTPRTPTTSAAAETFVVNLIGGPRACPLLPYRLLTYVVKFDVAIADPLIRKAAVFGCTSDDVKKWMQTFLECYVFESMQGHDLKKLTEIVVTRKGRFYHSSLAIYNSYLSSMLNDFDWKSAPPPYRVTDPASSMAEFLVRGVDEIIAAEKAEWAMVQKLAVGSPSMTQVYDEFLEPEPYSLRICRSMQDRFHKLAVRKVPLPADIKGRLSERIEAIRQAVQSGEIRVASN